MPRAASAGVAPAPPEEGSSSSALFVVRLPDGRAALRRGGFADWLRAGAQRFIALIDVRPTFRRGRFFGWRVRAYRGPGELLAGDIVRAVNGRPIERPEEFMAVWSAAGAREELTVHLVRGAQSVHLRLPIVD
ncbi:MAG: hypothetical protein IT371_31945 [Deltaproteobacteria bacterium]|nr:hypothetical protein [Deltaproteobacteria bacterium]